MSFGQLLHCLGCLLHGISAPFSTCHEAEEILENRHLALQVQGLNTEYERLRKESETKGADKGGASAVGEGPTNVQGLRKEIQSLQVPHPPASSVAHIEGPACSDFDFVPPPASCSQSTSRVRAVCVVVARKPGLSSTSASHSVPNAMHSLRLIHPPYQGASV